MPFIVVLWNVFPISLLINYVPSSSQNSIKMVCYQKGFKIIKKPGHNLAHAKIHILCLSQCVSWGFNPCPSLRGREVQNKFCVKNSHRKTSLNFKIAFKMSTVTYSRYSLTWHHVTVSLSCYQGKEDFKRRKTQNKSHRVTNNSW